MAGLSKICRPIGLVAASAMRLVGSRMKVTKDGGGCGVFSNADKDKLDIQGTILRGAVAGIYMNKLNGKNMETDKFFF